MERFRGQDLGSRPHIAVLFADKLGGFVVVTPLLRGLKEKYPDCVLDYFGGERTREFEEAHRRIDARFSLYGEDSLRRLARFVAERESDAGPYDLAVNLDAHPANAVAMTLLAPRYVVGRAYSPDLRRELPFLDDDRIDGLHNEFWSDADLLDRYDGVLGSTFIGEIFCRLARIETDYQQTELPIAEPGVVVPDVLISTGATRRAKLWPAARWRRLIDDLTERGFTVGLLGGAPSAQRQLYRSADDDSFLLESTALRDLRGRFTLPQVAGALRSARACVSVDNGIMHISYSVGTPTVAIFGASPWRVWAPRLPHLTVLLPDEPCDRCEERRFRDDECPRDRHVCMETVTPERVLAALEAFAPASGGRTVAR